MGKRWRKEERNILLNFSQNSALEWGSKLSCGKTEQVQETFAALEEKKGYIPKDIAFPAWFGQSISPYYASLIDRLL